MPLPFSFSTQRQSFDGETAVGTSGSAVYEVVMQQPPAHISTEPLMSTPLNAMPPAPAFPQFSGAEPVAPGSLPSFPLVLPPAPSPNQRVSPSAPADQRLPTLVADALNLPPPQPIPQAPSAPLLAHGPAMQADWGAQMEQLRNDIFGIAMNVSAVRDRVDRLDQRVPQSAAANLATLRGEIQVWLETHLNAAVEHCMRRIMTPAPPPAVAATPPDLMQAVNPPSGPFVSDSPQA